MLFDAARRWSETTWLQADVSPSKKVPIWRLPSGKLAITNIAMECYGKSPFFIGKSTLNGYIVPDIHLEDNLEKIKQDWCREPISHLENHQISHLEIPVLHWITPCPAEASHLEHPVDIVNHSHIFCIKKHIFWLFFTTGWMPLASYPWEASLLEHHKT